MTSPAPAATNTTSIIPLDELFATSAEWRDGHGKATAIARSTSAIVSTVASSLLIYIIYRSKAGLSITYHRVLLGMSISDILFSCGLISFNAVAPRDVDYMVWNARGDTVSCAAFGFLTTVGFLGGLLYTCALNLNYLAMVRYNKSQSYIKTKIEPFLLGVPALVAVVCSIVALLGQNLNPNEEGECATEPIYNPPHCIGYQYGDVRDGFEIPCGRGSGWTASFYYIVLFVVFVGVPLAICTSLFLMYRTVHGQESRTSTYGVGSLSLGHPSSTQHSTVRVDGSAVGDVAGNSNRTTSRMSLSITKRASIMISRRFSSATPSPGATDNSTSRVVMHRAMAYSCGYCLTWGWSIVYLFLDAAGRVVLAPPYPDWQIAFQYLTVIFSPLQGLFNFMIFMHPRVEKTRLSSRAEQKMSWCRAFGTALGSSLGIHWHCRKNKANVTETNTSNNHNDVIRKQKNRCSDNDYAEGDEMGVASRKMENESSMNVAEKVMTSIHRSADAYTEELVERRLSQGDEYDDALANRIPSVN